MNAVRAVRALGPIDLRSVRRDSLLRWMFLFPIPIVLLVRWGVPVLTLWLENRFQFDLSPYYPLLMSWVILMMPVMYGMVTGFLLLDQRDDDTLTALRVTPLSLKGYLFYRTTAPMLISMVLSVLVLPWAGLVRLEWWRWLLAVLAAAPLAPAYALLLAALAQNKVQGFALMKAAGVLSWPPMFAYFVDFPLQLAFGLVPTYWPAKLVWELEKGSNDYWPYLIIGLAFELAVIAILLRRFNRIMHR